MCHVRRRKIATGSCRCREFIASLSSGLGIYEERHIFQLCPLSRSNKKKGKKSGADDAQNCMVWVFKFATSEQFCAYKESKFIKKSDAIIFCTIFNIDIFKSKLKTYTFDLFQQHNLNVKHTQRLFYCE